MSRHRNYKDYTARNSATVERGTPNLAFLIGRNIEWLQSDYDNCEPNYYKVYIYSGTTINTKYRSVVIKLDDSNEKISLDAMTLARQATETCIRKFMTRVALGPSNKALLNDDTPHAIYGLRDPIHRDIRYVGMSKNVEARYKQHLHCHTNQYKNFWIQDLRSRGLLPELEIIEKIRGKFQALCHEDYWIQHYLDQGANLTNFESQETGMESGVEA